MLVELAEGFIDEFVGFDEVEFRIFGKCGAS